MIKQALLEELLAVALSTGGDFSEVYAEHTRSNTIQFVDGKVDKVNDTVLSGVGIRIFRGERTVYASTSDLTREGLLACARSAADAMGEGNAPISIRLNPTSVLNRHPVVKHPCTTDLSQRIDLLKAGCLSAKEYDAICHSKYGLAAFDGMFSFASRVKKYVPQVIFSVVRQFLSPEALAECQRLCDEAGVPLKVREYISE
jgi:predicted Zn-dependent protease